MIRPLSLASTRAAAAAARAEARHVLGFALLAEALLGLAALIAPTWTAALFGVDAGEGARLFGALLIGVTLMQTSALGDPGLGRIAVLGGVFARALVGLTAILGVEGLNILGAIELILAASVYLAFRRMIIAALSSRP
ncbi:hypothetical protein G5B40_03865 [Pikeienuella piscinae]|uniref:Uncharacterized protein n=1 Tax=Pikeienuella piscinae TaxID=2748098 RepID=A0A7L5BTE2_9RHOB|nr:hypothetical protein [Pikeienuella piscinae]QIE54652.1 hypothetical protein G5B40_03865 [Pikeienuella piscinae]